MLLADAIKTRMLQFINDREWSRYKIAREGALPKSSVYNIFAADSKSCTLRLIYEFCRTVEVPLSVFLDGAIFNPQNITDL